MSDKITSYLQLFGIHGEANDPRFPGYIPILSWSFGDDNSVAGSGTTRGGVGKVSVTDIRLTSNLELSSARLQEYCACGRGIKSGKLVTLAGDSVFFRATFEDLVVLTYQLGAGMICSFILSFHNMETSYDVKAVNARMKQVGWATTTNPAR